MHRQLGGPQVHSILVGKKQFSAREKSWRGKVPEENVGRNIYINKKSNMRSHLCQPLKINNIIWGFQIITAPIPKRH